MTDSVFSIIMLGLVAAFCLGCFTGVIVSHTK